MFKFSSTLLFVIIYQIHAESVGLLGGLSAEKNAVDAVQSLVEQVNSNEKLKDYGKLKAISYKTQVVSGTNFFVKVKPEASDNYLHLRIFKPLPNENSTSSLTAFQTNKSKEDEIEYF